MCKAFAIALVAIAAAAATCPAQASDNRSTQPVLQPGLADIVKARANLKDYVLDIKATFKPEQEQYQKAKTLYRDAFGKYDAWVTSVQSAIERGTDKDLPNDPQYKQLTKEAVAAGKEFTNYAESVTLQTRGLPLLAQLFDWGVKIWNVYRDRQGKERKIQAADFADHARWERWDEIKPKSDSATAATPGRLPR